MKNLWLLMLAISNPAFADINELGQVDFTEDRSNLTQEGFQTGVRDEAKQKPAEPLNSVSIIESAHATYEKFSNRVRVPGFISASPLPQFAKIVGANTADRSLPRMGDTVYVRWSAAPLPRPGERFSTFTPAIVLQSLMDPSAFDVTPPLGPSDKLPKERRLAGYFYETTGRLRVIRVKGGLVEAILEAMSADIRVGDEVMPLIPKIDKLVPIGNGIQLSAAVVCGSPADRLSTTTKSFIYINRGTRDGIRVGRVFESIETVSLEEPIAGPAPEVSNGEAIVVYASDSYSTAMITKTFNVIRIGSLLRTKQESNSVPANAPFEGFKDQVKITNDHSEPKTKPDGTNSEVPSLDNLPGSADTSLPDPTKKRASPAMSELDAMEQSMKLNGLTSAEKARLDKLSQQEKLRASRQEEVDQEAADNPGNPKVENSFKDSKKTAAKKAKPGKKKSKNDEEELNLLMMQN